MNTQHTPGPWKVQRYTEPGRFVTETCIRDAHNSHLCHVGPCNIEANSTLMAAAPDLLEALENSVNVLSLALRNGAWDNRSSDEKDSRDEVESVVAEALAAITKARGVSVADLPPCLRTIDENENEEL